MAAELNEVRYATGQTAAIGDRVDYDGWRATVEYVIASPDDVATSCVTVAELWYGTAKGDDPERLRWLWARFLDSFDVLPFDRSGAEQHGELRFVLRHSPIGERDLLIASIALACDLTLITDNSAEFSRVPGLRTESWVR